jgi:putative phage-type endonuclease
MSINETQESWLAGRSHGIGGSEVAAILGLSPWKTPYDIWMVKTGFETHDGPPLELTNEAVWWGKTLEAAIRQRYTLETGIAVVADADIAPIFPERSLVLENHTIVKHPDTPYFLGSPDGIAALGTNSYGVEIKLCGYQNEDWGAPYTDVVPINYYLQSMWYMIVTGLDVWDIAVLFSGTRLVIFRIHYNKEIADPICEALNDFWQKYVATKIAPPIDGSDGCARYLAKHFGVNPTTKVLTADEAALALAVTWRKHDAAKRAAEDAMAQLKNTFGAAIGSNKSVKGPFGTIGWVRPRASQRVQWEQLARAVCQQFTEPTEEIKQIVGQALNDGLAENPQADFCDASEIDRIVGRVFTALQKVTTLTTLQGQYTKSVPNTAYVRAWWKGEEEG